MQSIKGEQAMSDESFRAELRTWLAAHITDEFRERRTMTFQEKVAVRRAWQKKLFEAGWTGAHRC
jgi:alkylation response protein AidB-like acyl-CoA dehydrogenase